MFRERARWTIFALWAAFPNRVVLLVVQTGLAFRETSMDASFLLATNNDKAHHVNAETFELYRAMVESDQQQSRQQQQQQQRLPAPSLFRGPPSQNASTADLLSVPPPPGQSGVSARAALTRPWTHTNDRNPTAHDGALKGSTVEPAAKATRRQQKEAEQSNDERVDAMWAEMQNTLEEVELNAASGANVFGPAHARAIDELRKAQIALAQAWARSEVDDEGREDEDNELGEQQTVGTSMGSKGVFGGAGRKSSDDNAEDKGKAPRRSSEAARHERSQLEEETENDIRLARKRREANDRYFERVNQGVVDVVAKLAHVAERMREVELESREIWGEKDSIDGSSVV